MDALFFGMVGYFAMQRTPQKQRYGDEWAHPVVCKRHDALAGSLRKGDRFIAALFLAMLLDVPLAMAGLLSMILN